MALEPNRFYRVVDGLSGWTDAVVVINEVNPDSEWHICVVVQPPVLSTLKAGTEIGLWIEEMEPCYYDWPAEHPESDEVA